MRQVTSLFVRKLVAATGPKVDQRALLASVGLDADSPPDPQVMITDTAYYDLIEGIARQTDTTDLPLKTGGSMRCDDYGALGLAWKAAPTLLGSASRVARYARLWTDVVEYEVVTEPVGTWFIVHRRGPRRLGMRISNEATLASATAISREVSTEPFAPAEIHFKHLAPRTTAHHAAYFKAPVIFNSDRDAMLMSHETVTRPNKLGDRGITEFLVTHLDAELSKIEKQNSLRHLAREAIARSLCDGVPKMEEIAARLGMSGRSLHRKLADEGLTFKTLTEETRRELAEGLLRDDTCSLAEIAFLTGFSEQSSFTRAFKRWIGDTPATYRRGLTRA